MRMISQDERMDFPYEMCTIVVLGNEIIATPIGEPETEARMAEYSGCEQAYKAMKMLHNQYQEGLLNTIFRFPTQDEILE